ncbi:MAG: thioredoxin-disulfide reductase [Sphingobacteriales bacterium]|jgi:thioredoxin reductase (NADPH)|nr:thioredoxin-disulfide reductase [Sphingobacteriales bacterium]
MEHVKCLIIGSGPAGYTAAIYASRANLKPVLYTGVEVGGQLMQTTEVENYPGYPKGVQGPAMMDDFKAQAERMGTDIRWGYVTSVDFSVYPHQVTIDESTTLLADAVIISTGASAKWLGLESEARLNGYGVSACAVCDGFFYKNLEVAVVGGGDTACEEALYLANLCPKVHLLVRSNKMRASQVMQARVEANPNIQIHWHTQTLEILGDTQVTAMRVLNTQTNETSDIPIQGFFVAIGHKPNTDIFKGQIDLNPEGYIVTKAGSTYTNVAGVFACGDAQDSIYRQAVTAAGTGCMAALDAERWLSHEEFVKSQA